MAKTPGQIRDEIKKLRGELKQFDLSPTEIRSQIQSAFVSARDVDKERLGAISGKFKEFTGQDIGDISGDIGRGIEEATNTPEIRAAKRELEEASIGEGGARAPTPFQSARLGRLRGELPKADLTKITSIEEILDNLIAAKGVTLPGQFTSGAQVSGRRAARARRRFSV